MIINFSSSESDSPKSQDVPTMRARNVENFPGPRYTEHSQRLNLNSDSLRGWGGGGIRHEDSDGTSAKLFQKNIHR